MGLSAQPDYIESEEVRMSREVQPYTPDDNIFKNTTSVSKDATLALNAVFAKELMSEEQRMALELMNGEGNISN